MLKIVSFICAVAFSQPVLASTFTCRDSTGTNKEIWTINYDNGSTMAKVSSQIMGFNFDLVCKPLLDGKIDCSAEPKSEEYKFSIYFRGALDNPQLAWLHRWLSPNAWGIPPNTWGFVNHTCQPSSI